MVLSLLSGLPFCAQLYLRVLKEGLDVVNGPELLRLSVEIEVLSPDP